MNQLKILISIVLTIVVIGSIVYLNSQKVDRGQNDGGINVVPRSLNSSEENLILSPENTTPAEKTASNQKAREYPLAKEITTPNGFINTDGRPITIGEFIGKKVILIDFWTYSCINCQRTTPYLNAWHEKYSDKGLIIIGMHTPEFEFEKVYQNVVEATERLGIKYPVVLDNDYSTWNAYQNRFWPRKYLIDIDGYIVYDHIGEGQYEETEKKIQEALQERMVVLGETGLIEQTITKEISSNVGLRSPETYFGSLRNELFENGTAKLVGTQLNLSFPNQLSPHALYLSGDWDIATEFAQNNSSGARVAYQYTAKDVFLVAEADSEIMVEVLLDGAPLGAEAGADVTRTYDGKTVVKIKESRLYTIIKSATSETHRLEFVIPRQGLRAYAFTFG